MEDEQSQQLVCPVTAAKSQNAENAPLQEKNEVRLRKVSAFEKAAEPSCNKVPASRAPSGAQWKFSGDLRFGERE